MLLQTPNLLPLEFTQGDTPALVLVATYDQGNPIDLTGATLSTQIQGPNGVGPIIFPNSQHTISDQTANPGQFSLALSDTDTGNCGEGPHKEIITTVVISGVVTNFRGLNILTVYNPVPVQ